MRLRTAAVVATGVLVVGGGGTLTALTSSGLLDQAQQLLGSQLLQSPCLPELGGGIQAGARGRIKDLDEAQLRNVVDIAAAAGEVAKQNDLDAAQLLHALTVAYAAALVESDLRNLPSRAVPASLAFDYDTYPGGRIPPGDHTSVGLFQQLDAWGPVSARMSRKASARMFLTGGRAGQPGLLDITGWDRLDPGVVAQRVQVSAYPLRYGERVAQARAIAAVVLGTRSADDGQVRAAAAGAASGVSAGLFGGSAAGGCEPVQAAARRGGSVRNCPRVRASSERGLTPDAVAVLRCGLGDYPMIRAYGCLATSGHTPGSDHYTGRACDFMIPGQGSRDTADGMRIGNSMAEYFVDNHETFGVTYVIWHGRIWNSARADEGWRTYRHPSGSQNWTLMHMDHVHVSVKGQAGVYGWGS